MRKSKKQLNEEFIKKYQGKHFCKCGCGEKIIIISRHRLSDIPDYIQGHNAKEFMNRPEEKERISKQSKERWKEPGRKEIQSRQIIEFYEKNPEERERASKQMKERRKTMVIPVKDTSIEVKIQNFLKQLGIEFFTHQYMKIEHGYQCDILIPYLNMVIECDGDYWHKYPIGNDIDHIRTKELLKKGFKVLRLWEFEINDMNINEFEKKLNIK